MLELCPRLDSECNPHWHCPDILAAEKHSWIYGTMWNYRLWTACRPPTLSSVVHVRHFLDLQLTQYDNNQYPHTICPHQIFTCWSYIKYFFSFCTILFAKMNFHLSNRIKTKFNKTEGFNWRQVHVHPNGRWLRIYFGFSCNFFSRLNYWYVLWHCWLFTICGFFFICLFDRANSDRWLAVGMAFLTLTYPVKRWKVSC